MTTIRIKIGGQPISTTDWKQEIVRHTEKVVTNDKKKNDIINFLNGKNVKSSRRRKRAYLFVCSTLLAAWINTSRPAYANAETNVLPPEVDDVLFKVQLVCLGICVGVAIIMAMVAGFFRMIGLREEAKKRYADAVAGMTMVLTAPVVLGVIATIVRGLLKLFPNYAS